MQSKVISRSPKQTEEIAREFAETVLPGSVVSLYGGLGAGKTRFVRGFVKAFGISPDEVDSPTFTIINEYHGETPIYHFDFYRLDDVREAIEIGAEEYFYGDGVCLIEWPERISGLLPSDCINITLTIKGKTTREISIDD
ncbi:MAG: tRNA (adenosine(37)-N6)-threonylcarbamoyltransferase complex ATPase subunit type 1 TsaE [Bacteroidetes bacterium]|jgi:tRNA threonylcarbamoyladenosine biosynthesis protein TsaE|nr:tRNA (adenosine(37)-N6)-threonylcarbamoyltransferase complex ATPase subunit type 1 TsaE [Bacteroidota bacterium]